MRLKNFFLRYYPPEKQGLRLGRENVRIRKVRLRYYPPEKQGLRLDSSVAFISFVYLRYYPPENRYYPPEKQGLRHSPIQPEPLPPLPSDTILQKNKD